MNWQRIVALVLSVGTLASPIDLIPDVLGPLGLTDDAIAVVVAIITLVKAFRSWRAARRTSRDAKDTPPAP